MQFTVEQAMGLAPDESSAKAAKGLVVPAKWPLLGMSDEALWGECQGSGSKPYQVQMDVNGPTFRCSCPSRKFPCKHGLALLLLHTQQRGTFTASAPPVWVSEWLASRQQRAVKQEQKKSAESAGATSVADPQAAAKREAKRQERMAAGAADLQRWMADQVRHGLANASSQSAAMQALAARMVDAQAPGLAFRVRQLQDIVDKGGLDWPARLLAHMGRLQLLLDAFQGRETLPQLTQADVLAALGWTVDKEEVVVHGEHVADSWTVLGQSLEENAKLWERRVWLHGQNSGRYALLLDFSHGNRHFEHSFFTGMQVKMKLAFFPGTASLRALAVDSPETCTGSEAVPQTGSLNQALINIADFVATNPWQWLLPFSTAEGFVQTRNSGWALQTESGYSLPLILHEDDGWQLTALGGGAPMTIFGEWNGERLRPLSGWTHTLVWTESVRIA